MRQDPVELKSSAHALSESLCNEIRKSFLSPSEPSTHDVTASFFKQVANDLPSRFSAAQLSTIVTKLLADDAAIDLLNPQVMGEEIIARFREAKTLLKLLGDSPAAKEIKARIEELEAPLKPLRALKRNILLTQINDVIESLPPAARTAIQKDRIDAVRSIDLKEYYSTAQKLASFVYDTVRAGREISLFDLFSNEQHPLVRPVSTRMEQIDATNAYIVKISYYGIPEITLLTPLGALCCYQEGFSDENIEAAIPGLIKSLGLTEIPHDQIPHQPFTSERDRFFLVGRTPDSKELPREYGFKLSSDFLDPKSAQDIWAECLPEERAISRTTRKFSNGQLEFLARIKEQATYITEEAKKFGLDQPLSSKEIEAALKFDPETGPNPDIEGLIKLRANGTRSLAAIAELDISYDDGGPLATLVVSFGEEAVPYLLQDEFLEQSDAAKLLLTLYNEEGAGWFRAELYTPDSEFHKQCFALLSAMGLLTDRDVLANFRTLDSDDRAKLIDAWEKSAAEMYAKPDLVAEALQLLIQEPDHDNAYRLLGAIRSFGAVAPERVVPLALQFAQAREDNQWGLDVFGQYGKAAEIALPLLSSKAETGGYWEQHYARCSIAAIERDIRSKSTAEEN
jgi:hypothetical protein